MSNEKPTAQKVRQQLHKRRARPSPPLACRAEVAAPASLLPTHAREPNHPRTSLVDLDGALPTQAPKLIADLRPHVELAWAALQEAGFRLPEGGAMKMGDDAWIECRPPIDTKANGNLEDREQRRTSG
jgi:hypothetical protein